MVKLHTDRKNFNFKMCQNDQLSVGSYDTSYRIYHLCDIKKNIPRTIYCKKKLFKTFKNPVVSPSIIH